MLNRDQALLIQIRNKPVLHEGKIAYIIQLCMPWQPTHWAFIYYPDHILPLGVLANQTGSVETFKVLLSDLELCNVE